MDEIPSRCVDAPAQSRFAGDLTHECIGAFYEVYNALRYGLLESTYANALELELLERGLPIEREAGLQVHYKGRVVGLYRADIIVDGRLILELKAQGDIGHPERRQLLHYLRVTRLRLGLVLNFGPEAKILRVVNG